jgi:hypothetical protein
MTSGIDYARAAQIADLVYATSGIVGYVAILDSVYPNRTVSSINTTTDVLTTTAAHEWVDATRVRIASTGTLPTTTPTVDTATDYYVGVVDSDELALYLTAADAIADSGRIDFSDSGSGTITLQEQALDRLDTLEVMVNHEVASARLEYSSVGFADVTTGLKAYKEYTLTEEITLRHWVLIVDGVSTVGDVTGDKDYFHSYDADVTIPPEGKVLRVQLGVIDV